jgi:hypothetical protein
MDPSGMLASTLTTGRNERLRFQIADFTFCISKACLLDVFYVNSLGGTHLLAALAEHERDMFVAEADSGVIFVDRPSLYFQRYLADVIMKGGSAGSLLVFQKQMRKLDSAELSALLEECEFFQLATVAKVAKYHLTRKLQTVVVGVHSAMSCSLISQNGLTRFVHPPTHTWRTRHAPSSAGRSISQVKTQLL